MLKGFNVSLFDLVISLSSAIDLISPAVANHHKRVAYIAHTIGKEMELTEDETNDLLMAGSLHDCGALFLKERLDTLEFEIKNPHVHAESGYWLLKTFDPFSKMAYLIRFHHVPWNNGEGVEFRGNPVSIGSHVLQLADRLDILIDKNREILSQADTLQNKIIEQEGKMFIPTAVEAFKSLAKKECFWLDIISPNIDVLLRMRAKLNDVNLSVEYLFRLTEVLSQVIDFRSPFTSTHSSGVAAIAETLARLSGFSREECQKMKIAGYLHDLGKLAVPAEILEKPGKLTEEEFNVMRSHTFYTYRILEPLDSLNEINEWASFHHERMDGNGYPFHLGASELPFCSRIMAVADVFTAITENRPYREGMQPDKALRLLKQFADNSALDAGIVALLTRHFNEANEIRTNAQTTTTEKYHEFSRHMILK